jgi:hypothetical protein
MMDLLTPENPRILIEYGDENGDHFLVDYYGERSKLAIQRELTRLRQSGDVWARALIEAQDPLFGQIGVDILTDEKVPWPQIPALYSKEHST